MYRCLLPWIALALASATSAAPAAEKAGFIDKRKLEPAKFEQVVMLLDEEMQAGGRFEFVTPVEETNVKLALQRMRDLLDGKQALSDLSEDERVALINAQGQVNAILTKRDRERLICERAIKVGSHRRETVCETYGDKMLRSQSSRDRVNELNKRIQRCNDAGVCTSG